MKGLAAIAKKSQNINQKDKSTWVWLYYSLKEDKVYDKPADDRWLVCYLINPHTPKQVQEAVEEWKKL